MHFFNLQLKSWLTVKIVSARLALRSSSNLLLLFVDADKDDTGKYKVEISNDIGVGVCDVPVRVKGW